MSGKIKILVKDQLIQHTLKVFLKKNNFDAVFCDSLLLFISHSSESYNAYIIDINVLKNNLLYQEITSKIDVFIKSQVKVILLGSEADTAEFSNPALLFFNRNLSQLNQIIQTLLQASDYQAKLYQRDFQLKDNLTKAAHFQTHLPGTLPVTISAIQTF